MGNSFRQTVAGIFSRADMTSKVMLSGHLASTKERAILTEGAYLIAAQDTCFYNYSGHKSMEGLGYLQGNIRGIIQHNTLLMNELGLPLGLIEQEYWTRKGAVVYEGKESQKWEKSLDLVNEHFSSMAKKVVLVQDREADIFSFFKAKRSEGIELLVRVHQPRNIEIVGSGAVKKLQELGQELSEIGEKTVVIHREGKQVTLTLSLKASKVHIFPDKNLSPVKHKTQELSMVIAQEIKAIDEKGKDVFEADNAAIWYLLSSLPIDNQEDIERIVTFYSLRWRIERFHYTMKSGALNVEKLQFDDVKTLFNSLAFYSIVAWQILAITYLIRQDKDEQATACFEEKEVVLLQKVAKKQILTVKDAVLALAKIVGFAPSKKQPFPDIKVLAMAVERLFYMKIGYENQ
jgi:dsDNA-binding SOS-regulon protein